MSEDSPKQPEIGERANSRDNFKQFVDQAIDRASHRGGLLGGLARHRTAANLLMVLLVMAGIWAVSRIQTQFFPDASRDIIRVSVAWSGATADDIDRGIVDLLEPQLRFLDKVETISSSSTTGSARITLFYQPGTDMQQALSEVETALSQVSSLPEGAEEPRASQALRYETISRLVLSGPYSEAALQQWGLNLRDELLNAGIDRVALRGVREQQIVAEVSNYTLRKLGLTLDQVAQQVRAASSDIPAGEIGDGRSLVRSLGRIQGERDLREIEIVSERSGAKITLGELAQVRQIYDPDQTQLFRDGNPAVELEIERSLTADSLKSAAIVDKKLAEWQASAPETLKVEQYSKRTDYLRARIGLLLKNGVGGMVLVLLVLFVFMNTRSAIWVAAGIPTALLVTVAIMLMMNLTINMISVFAMLLTLGIIVDDAIVVSEHSETMFRRGASAEDAAIGGAKRMFFPVLSSSLTTVAAFAPLLLIGGFMGRFMADIPMVVSIVILASLIECFFVLPGHMRHSLGALEKTRDRPTALRAGIDNGFRFFRERMFRPVVVLAVKLRYGVVALTLLSLLWAVAMVSSGTLPFTFFSVPDGERVSQQVRMVAGASREQTQTMVKEMERAFWVAMDKVLDDQPSDPAFVEARRIEGKHPVVDMLLAEVNGSGSGRISAELVPADDRRFPNRDLVRIWTQEINRVGAVESLVTRRGRFGGSATDIDFEIIGPDIERLKQASLQVQGLMAEVPGLDAIQDDLPYGTPEKIIRLNRQGRALGLSLEQVGRQLRSAIEGIEVERLQRGDQETPILLRLAEAESQDLALGDVTIVSNNGDLLRLSDIATIEDKVGLSQILREDGQRLISVTADLVDEEGDANEAIEKLKQRGIGGLVERAGLSWRFAGEAEEQREAFSDFRTAVIVALVTMYVILAWVFGSYAQPVIVLLSIPFGFVGAAAGLYWLGYPLSFLALIALAGLSGIIVNDSIILVSTINELRQRLPVYQAIVEGSAERLRAVLLTTTTTIGGLTPMLFETSRQAKFLIPMAVVIVFGLAFATLVVLVFVPALLAIFEDVGQVLRRALGGGRGQGASRPAASLSADEAAAGE